jgi:pimeloyl-ACP methyl ester carboxylesterase
MAEAFCSVGDVELCYETFGSPADPAMLLIMGLGTQMIAWPDEFCAQLADGGFFVIRFDNRDVGRSTQLHHLPVPSVADIALRRPAGGYSLSDMATDAIGLLDHLDVDAAHIVGASMGGMIAQLIAIEHPDRALSLASIMSNTGSRLTGQPALRVQPLILQQPPSDDPQAQRDRLIKLFGIVGSPGFERNDERLLDILYRSQERGGAQGGVARHLAAIVISPNRARALRWVRTPTVVIHGTADKLVRPSGGRATARAIPDAELVLIKGMGHDLPEGAWPQVIAAIVRNAQRAVPSRERVPV